MLEVMAAVMATISNFCQKPNLTEYEMLMYEQLCNLTNTWAKCNELAARGNWYDLEQQVDKIRQEYEKWLEGEDGENQSTSSTD